MLRDRGQMSERDYRTYVSLFSNMSNFMRKPNLIIYLDVTPEQSLERIKYDQLFMIEFVCTPLFTNVCAF